MTQTNPASLFLENTYERGPAAIIALLQSIRAAGGKVGAKTAFCFDLGHWFSFAGGSGLGNLEAWLELITPWLGHLHLHDNDGNDDQHLGLGRGRIPLESFRAALAGRRLACGFTLEPHDLKSLAVSLDWIGHNPPAHGWLRLPD